MFSRFTIRTRITLGSVLIAAIIFTGALLAARAQVVSILESANGTLAADDLVYYADEIMAAPTDPIDDSGKGLLIYIRDPHGVVEVNTLPTAVQKTVEDHTEPTQQFEVIAGNTTFAVATRTVPTSAGNWTMWAARSTAAGDLALRGLDAVFVVGAVVFLVIFAVASWLLASAALRPVMRLREQAESLSGDSIEILPVTGSRDEISDLAGTLNALLVRVRESTAREKQVISDAAHELRTPLAALKIQLELAHDDFDDTAALAGQVIAAEKSVARLSSLANNLLELSRLASAAHSDSSSSEQLAMELTDSVDRARMLALTSGAEINFTIDTGTRASHYPIAAANFGRICDNLLANSITAIETSGLEVARVIDAGFTETDAALVVTVSDSGPGMAETFIPHAFDRFSRADQSRTGHGGGSGLGLALVQAIVTNAGGSINLRNTSPGLRVTISIPKM